MKTFKTKKFVKITLRGFLIIKKYFASTIQDLFHFYKKGFLNSQVLWGLGLTEMPEYRNDAEKLVRHRKFYR
jgi:hypothetical protein